MEVNDQLHAPAALLPGKEVPVSVDRLDELQAGLNTVENREISPCLYSSVVLAV
jgi:hypothetical protein